MISLFTSSIAKAGISSAENALQKSLVQASRAAVYGGRTYSTGGKLPQKMMKQFENPSFEPPLREKVSQGAKGFAVAVIEVAVAIPTAHYVAKNVFGFGTAHPVKKS